MKEKKAVKKNAKVQSTSPQKYLWLVAAGIAAFTFVLLAPVLSFDFLNWDDPTFVLGNKSITALSFSNIKTMFSSFYMGNYCPLAVLSYALDYHFAGGLHPHTFHFTSLLLHIANTLMVFFFIYFLSNKKIAVAVVAGLLFGIHPMHLESVVWVAERRDVLYAFFYLAGLICYVRYADSGFSKKYLLYALLFFTGSLLSKGQAVTFPVVLLLVDYIRKREWNAKMLLEKIPFFILSLVFGYVAIVAQRTTPAVNVFHMSFFQSFLSGCYGLFMYLTKALVPFSLAGYHPYPFVAGGSMPVIFYLAPLIIIALVVLLFIYLKKDRAITGGLLIFLLTIFPVLQFLPVGETILSERYTYIPYLGLFFVIGHAYHYAAQYCLLQKIKSMAGFILVAFLISLSVVTRAQLFAWKDAVSFWTNVIEQYPHNHIAYNNRGHMYNETGQYDLAIKDFDKAMTIDSTYARLYLNRGLSYERKKDYQRAITDYSRSIRLDSTYVQPILNRGVMYTDALEQYENGIRDFKKALSMDSLNVLATNDLGVAYMKNGNYELAVSQFTKAIAMDSTNGKIYFYRALTLGFQKKYYEAIADANKARQLQYAVDENVVNDWVKQAATNNK